MCGIVGGWWPGRPTGETLDGALDAALGALVHRGPDDEGRLVDGEVFLAMRRLSILDLAGGAQPLFNEDRSVAVVANGEIYNFVELRRQLEGSGHRFASGSDVEVLVHLWERDGITLVQPLAGMFAFALWDRKGRQLVLGRDRFGKKPLFFRRLAGGVLFASEIKALVPLLEAAGVPPQLEPQGIYDYLSLGCVPQPSTVWREVEALPPGALLRCSEAGIEIETWWRPPAPDPRPRPPFRQALEQVRRHVAQAVAQRLRSDVPLGVFLSGGVDSSVVAWEAAQHLGPELQTFTVRVSDPGLDESPVAARTARTLGVSNTPLPLEVAPSAELERLVAVFDQPFADPSALPTLAISRLAAEHVKVVLTGDGGDEIFAGYRRYLAARGAGALGWLARLLRPLLPTHAGRRSALGFAARFGRGLGLAPGARYLTWTTDMLLEEDKVAWWRGAAQRPTEAWLEQRLPAGLSSFETQVRGDLAVNLLSDLLVKMDRATMAASLEARSPLLDHRLAERVLAWPASLRLRRWRLKALLKAAYRDRLPKEVLAGPKRGFEIPLDHWLAHDLRPVLMDTVGAPGARLRQLLDGAAIDALLRGETFRERNRAYLLWSLLVLELWLRRWT